jgi:hypothetical protein
MVSPLPIFCIASAQNQHSTHTTKRQYTQWYTEEPQQKNYEEGTPYNTKLINNDILKSTSDIVRSAIDSLKKNCYLKMALRMCIF